MKLKEALVDNEISYRDFADSLMSSEVGDWNNVNSTETIQEYIIDMLRNDIHISHIVTALEQNSSQYNDWCIWLGNSMETPSPINSKEELITALGLSNEDLEREITF